MKNVWFIQDQNDMRVHKVFTTKKAVFAETKKAYGKGRFETIAKGRIYWYIIPNDIDSVCSIEKVPVIHERKVIL